MASFLTELMKDRFDIAVVILVLSIVYLQHYLLSRSTRRHQEHTQHLIAAELESTDARRRIVAAMRLDTDGDGGGGDDEAEELGRGQGGGQGGGASRRGALGSSVGGSVAESEGTGGGGTNAFQTFFDKTGYWCVVERANCGARGMRSARVA